MICSSHEEEKVFRIAKGIIPPHSSACMVIHWCSAACCASGIKGLSLGKLQVSGRHMRPNRPSFWIRHPQNRGGGHGERPTSNAHVPSRLPPASSANGQLRRTAKFVGLRKIRISPETVVRTASTCGCMLHGVVDGCCSPGCTPACGGGCGVAPAPVAPAAVVGGAAGGGYPQPTGCMGKRVTLKYPCSSSNTKRKMQ